MWRSCLQVGLRRELRQTVSTRQLLGVRRVVLQIRRLPNAVHMSVLPG